MEKVLATTRIEEAMDREGLNQAAVAERLAVSRESVSKWLRRESFPKPDKLLRLATLLGLPFSQLVEKHNPNEPLVAFRKMKATKTTEAHYEHARTMGKMLEHLTEFLPFDGLSMPPVLKKPVNEYGYLQEVATRVRSDLGIDNKATIEFNQLINNFRNLQTVLIPVLWGSKNRHENAVHIHLPESQTTWIYLNLDANILDFKFWMAHELGHCLAPSLKGDEGEDFADAFAGALLFPEELAEDAYHLVTKEKTKASRLGEILTLSLQHVIAPYSIYCQINAYAEAKGLEKLALVPDIHRLASSANARVSLVSKLIFKDDTPPEAAEYIETIQGTFNTPFFDVLRAYLKRSGKGPGFVQTLMDVPVLDARSLHAELT